MWSVAVVLAVLQTVLAEQPWWRSAVYYRVLVDSFKDSDGDGLGDIPGTTKQLSYVRALGADAVIISSVLAAGADCTAPGAVRFADVDDRYGNDEQFDKLLEKANRLELKLLVTLPMQSVSTSSELVNSSAEGRPGYEDVLVWRPGNSDEPPTVEGVDAWSWHEGRSQHYATTATGEALLNLCSEAVAAALSEAQCSWLRRGVAGVVISLDFPMDVGCGVRLGKKLAAAAKSCARSANMDPPVILVDSSLDAAASAAYYEFSAGVISSALAGPAKPSAPDLALGLYASILYTPEDSNAIWLTSMSNHSRIANRYGNEMVDAILLLALSLPGAVLIQQGDELGAGDTILEWADVAQCWPARAHASAAPFPWDDTPTASFTAGKPWLPLAPNYRYANAKAEFANDLSHVGVTRVAVALRKSPAMGPHVEITRFEDTLSVLRWGGPGTLLVVTNLGSSQSEVTLTKIPGLSPAMTVIASSGGSSLNLGSQVTLDKVLKLSPGEAVLLAGPARHCGGPGPVDKITTKLSEGWQKLNKYFSNL